MRKTLRIVGIAIIAVLMYVNFVSCSTSDEIEENISSQKKLIQMKCYEPSGVMTFDYDYASNDKLRTITLTSKYGVISETDITNITWGNNTITENSGTSTTSYLFDEGLIRSGSWELYSTHNDNYLFSYDSDKHLSIFQVLLSDKSFFGIKIKG